jgi:hypothetical protein
VPIFGKVIVIGVKVLLMIKCSFIVSVVLKGPISHHPYLGYFLLLILKFRFSVLD